MTDFPDNVMPMFVVGPLKEFKGPFALALSLCYGEEPPSAYRTWCRLVSQILTKKGEYVPDRPIVVSGPASRLPKPLRDLFPKELLDQDTVATVLFPLEDVGQLLGEPFLAIVPLVEGWSLPLGTYPTLLYLADDRTQGVATALAGLPLEVPPDPSAS